MWSIQRSDCGSLITLQLGSPWIERLQVWKKQQGIDGTITEDEHVEQPDATPAEDFPIELRSFNFRRTWICPESTPIDNLLSYQDFEVLGNLTKCHFGINSNENTVYVCGHEEELVQLAVRKLENILNQLVKNLSFRTCSQQLTLLGISKCVV